MLAPMPAELAPETPAIRVLVVDDDAPIRAIVVSLLEATEDMHPVGQAADGRAALDLVSVTAPDVVLMDVSMPRISGIEATRLLVADGTGSRVLIHSADARLETVNAARAAGAGGYLLKRGRAGALLRAIRVVHAGGAVWPDDGGSPW